MSLRFSNATLAGIPLSFGTDFTYVILLCSHEHFCIMCTALCVCVNINTQNVMHGDVHTLE